MNMRILSSEDYTESSYSCRYLVVGSGAGGSVAGALLAEKGHDVIFLEEGGHYPTSSYTSSISEMTARLYRNRGVFPFLGKPSIGFAEGCCVGGGTVINGGLIWRTPSWVLDEWRDLGLEGYSMEELKEHFETVEKDLHVVTHEPEQEENLDSMKLLDASEKMGWKYVMVPRAVIDCSNTNLCPTGCTTGAKQSTLVTYIPRAVEKGARVFSRCRAVRIVHSGKKAGKVIARVMDGGSREIEISFDHLVLAGGAVQTPHLLRRSGISAAAGKKLGFHMNLKVVARFKDKIEAERGTMFTVQVQEYARDGVLITASNIKPHYIAMALSHFGNEVINSALENYQNLGIFAVMVRPKSTARVMSGMGDQPVVTYSFDPADLVKIKSALRRSATLLFEAGALELYMPIVGVGTVRSMDELDRRLDGLSPGKLEIITVHIMASCPMGADQSVSVTRPDGRLWNMENITIADASILPSNIGTSPQGTIMAFVQKIINGQI